MANLARLQVNSRAIREGAWQDLPADYDGLRLKVKGMGRAYTDMRSKLVHEEAARLNCPEDTLPEDVQDLITAKCLGAHVLLDVANLADGEAAVSVEQYRDLMLDPDRAPLVTAVLIAAGNVGRRLETDLKVAEGNSSSGSTGS